MDKMKFDETAVDTNLANEYLKNNSIFKSKGFKDSEDAAYNGFKNTIRYSDYKRTSGMVVLCGDISDVPKKLYNLAKKIKENVDLFCQLELLIRKIPLEETKNIDLELIIQNLIYYSSHRRPEVAKTNLRQIVVCRDSPLLVLGCLAQTLIASMPRVVIECTKETAPVCSLFTQLCHEVGFEEKVLLAILLRIPDDSLFKVTMDFKNIKDFLEGGVGIVTGKCDVDSAVDTFIAASSRYPWALKKIYVQENVLERFKRALEWKAEKRAPGDDEASYRCGDKVFAMDATGEVGTRVVALEAYRTVRELLALLDALKPLAASLWSSDVAESLEISHGLGANIVWVNDFADFRGPPGASQAFYSVVDSYFSTQMMQYMTEFDEVGTIRESWLRLDIDERKDLILNALSKIDNKEATKIIEDIETRTFEMDSFIHVTEDTVTTGVELLPETMIPSSFYDKSLDLSIVSYIVKGGAILLHIPERMIALKKSTVSYMFYENLRTLGAPVIFMKENYKFGNIPIIRNPINRYKVIWTHYGTTFAN